jgi:hypothetical protein
LYGYYIYAIVSVGVSIEKGEIWIGSAGTNFSPLAQILYSIGIKNNKVHVTVASYINMHTIQLGRGCQNNDHITDE